MADFTVGDSADHDQLNRDLNKLEHLVYDAIEVVLDEHRTRLSGEVTPPQATERADDAIEEVDTFLPVFRQKHPDFTAPPVIKFRLELLTFTVLFCRRFLDSISSPGRRRLEALRDENRSRTREFYRALPPDSTHPCMNPDLPVPRGLSRPLVTELLLSNRERLLDDCNVLRSSAPRSREEDVPLKDTLPMFMKLNATVVNENPAWSLNEAWFALAAEYMLQAALEQYALDGATGDRALKQCFAWGSNEAMQSTDDEGLKANFIFSSGGDEMERRWEATQAIYLQETIPDGREALQHRVSFLMRRFPLATFDRKIMTMLAGFLAIHDQPTAILAGLEEALDDLIHTGH